MLTRLRDFLLLLPEGSLRRALLILLLLIGLLFPFGMIWTHEINDNLQFGQQAMKDTAGSKSVVAAIALIDREVNQHSWTPNKPFFMPAAWLQRMPAYQAGIMSAISRFAIELGDQIGRTRGSSQIDPDLDTAAGRLKYPADVWVFNFSVSFFPTSSSESQYRSAMKALHRYNSRLINGQAIFERRADNLQATLERIALDLGSASAAIANHIDDRGLIDSDADTIYYDVKGRMYAYYLLLKGMEQDFAQVIAEKQLGQSWKQMQESLAAGAELDEFMVFNNAPDSQFLPNHLTGMGFYLLRARTQIREISNILLK